ncbi:drug/metabolite transporter, DME family [Micromonospora echinaurantiaca]|uniref:Drug/metabolite transporter, DME family n=1 Tax=Micromonospora echinaurantiaca TaxID=47857 RepID=A0A1C5JDU0_9ACTN|nr:EamA family transporter [Micromonospora echinaurantiaca]SCG68730.1 drug/metabolite transporter, DME family [Micromonospora echinaurantiaca]
MSRSFRSPSLPTLPTARRRPASSADLRVGLLSITGAAALWGTTGVAVQLLRQSTALTPTGIGFYRLAIGAVVLVALLAGRLGPMLAALRSAPVVPVLVGVGLGAYQALYFVAVAAGGVGVATLVSLGVAPVLVFGWETLRARRLPERGLLGALVTGLVGLVLITVSAGQPSADAPRPLLGLLAAFGSGVGYAASTVLSRHAAQRVAALTLTTVSAVVGALVLAPVAVLDGLDVPARAVPVGLLVYLGVVTTALAYVLFYAGLRTTTGGSAALATLVEPLTAVLLAGWLIGETMPASAFVGGALLLGAVTVVHLRAGK